MLLTNPFLLDMVLGPLPWTLELSLPHIDMGMLTRGVPVCKPRIHSWNFPHSGGSAYPGGEAGSYFFFISIQSLGIGTVYPHCPWQAGAERVPMEWALAPLLLPWFAAVYSRLLLSASSVPEVDTVL